MLSEPIDWAAAQRQAEAEGRACVVGGLLVRDGRVFVMRRAPDRRLFPGGWDIVGGHVEPGETLPQALAREIKEETGWALTRVGDVVEVFDWEVERAGQIKRKREFDFLVEVTGDLDRPTLEADKFSEYRWVGSDDLAVLRENRSPGDDAIIRLVTRAVAGTRPVVMSF